MPSASAGITLTMTKHLFNATLTARDEKQSALPYLATPLPVLNSDSWQVRPDGRMETTYRLKPNLTWHDGHRFTADDFVFAQDIYSWPEFGMARSQPYTLIESVTAPDATTVVFTWAVPYPQASALFDEFLPLPRHLLGESFTAGQIDAFSNLTFWSRDYVGLGPFRIQQWEPGVYIDAAAFPGYALGSPHIQRMRIAFIADQNTVLANLLSGAVDAAVDGSVGVEQGAMLRRDWVLSGEGRVLTWPNAGRYVYAQLRPETARPAAILDSRVRRALAHAIDKQGLVDGLLGGEGLPDHTFVSPQAPFFADVDRAVTKYPYDLRLSEQAMQDVGFTKGADGFYASPSQGRFTPDHQVNAGAVQWTQEQAILVDGWRRAGFDMSASQLPREQQQDNQNRVRFTTHSSTLAGCATVDEAPRSLATDAIPTPENRWRGSNRGAWSEPEFDRVAAAFATTLDPANRGQQAATMMKIVSDAIPGFPLYCNVQVAAHTADLTGPIAGTDWNLHLWQWRS
jgi:peptide/nickel transport system substrate-binding protein